MVTNEYFKKDGGLQYDKNKEEFPIDEVAASTIEKIDGHNQNMHNVRMQENVCKKKEEKIFKSPKMKKKNMY